MDGQIWLSFLLACLGKSLHPSNVKQKWNLTSMKGLAHGHKNNKKREKIMSKRDHKIFFAIYS